MSEKMKNLALRTLSGVVLAAVVLGAIVWSQWSFGLLLALLLLGGMHEFYALTSLRGDRPQRFTGFVTGAMLLAINFAVVSRAVVSDWPVFLLVCLFAFLLLLVPLMFVCELFRKGEHPAANIGVTLAGVCYVAVPLSMLCYLPVVGSSTGEWDPWVMLFYVFIIWANDVMAYLVGMTLGRRKLFERLSPKKSWEGFFGGVAGAAGVGVAASYHFGTAWWVWTGLALTAAVTGVLGDLAESMLKRAAGIKDSGSLIPGHGGVLDRFDAMFISAPFVFVYLLLLYYR